MNYDGCVTYESAIRKLFVRMPDLEPLYQEQFSYLEGEESPYVVFGSFLIPALEAALESRNSKCVEAICTYLEEAAIDAGRDAGLEQLLLVEIGEWLSGTPLEAEIAASLGERTKHICRYVPGLATQRTLLKMEQEKKRFFVRKDFRRILDRKGGEPPRAEDVID